MIHLPERREKYLNPAAIIMAPSATGKSHYVRHHDTLALDGDDVVTKTLGWPERWDGRTKDDATIVSHYVHWACVVGMSAAIKQPALFNGKIFARGNTWLAIASVSGADLMRNLASRDPDHMVTPESYEVNLESLRAGAKSTGYQVLEFNGLEQAVNRAREWLRGQKSLPFTGWPKSRKTG